MSVSVHSSESGARWAQGIWARGEAHEYDNVWAREKRQRATSFTAANGRDTASQCDVGNGFEKRGLLPDNRVQLGRTQSKHTPHTARTHMCARPYTQKKRLGGSLVSGVWETCSSTERARMRLT